MLIIGFGMMSNRLLICFTVDRSKVDPLLQSVIVNVSFCLYVVYSSFRFLVVSLEFCASWLLAFRFRSG